LRSVAEKAKPNATLLFYYAGHGQKGPGGAIAFLNYDAGSKKAATPAFAVAEIGTTLQRHFKGGAVFLLADCCYSGGLTETAKALSRAGIKAASLTSADADNISTGSWSFTQTILDGLNGDPLIDANGDGTITLGELAAEVSATMKYREKQKAGFTTEGVSPD